MVVLRKTAAAMMNYITRCCTPYEAKAATEHFDEEVLKYLCEIQRINRNELTAITVEELLSPLLFGGTGIVATAQIAATGIPFLASVAMALATMRRIAGDDKAFDYFEGALKASREKHTYLKKSLPESASAFAAKYAEGAMGKSGKKIKVNGLQAKWTLIFNNNKSKTRSTRRICREILRKQRFI